MFTKILVAYDRSAHARAALGHAIDIARTQQALRTLLVTRFPGSPRTAPSWLAWTSLRSGAWSAPPRGELSTRGPWASLPVPSD
jgi:nucleotide-binding universal stress UspA family protein